MTQENLSLSAYHTKFKALWDEYINISQPPKCTCHCSCGAAKLIQEYEDLHKLTQFLMGLNDSFSNIRVLP